MAIEVFLDTGYIIALSSADDELHAPARSLRQEVAKARWRLVTTRAVLLEIGNTLAKMRFRREAVTLLDAFEVDPNVQIVPLSEGLYAQGLRLFRARPDKEWGLVDCISFVVMQERGIYEALTADEHFWQAGFRVVLRE